MYNVLVCDDEADLFKVEISFPIYEENQYYI